MFLRYSPGHKGFKTYSLDSKKVVVSRDVIFHKQIYPFRNAASTELSSGLISVKATNITLPNVPKEDLDHDNIVNHNRSRVFQESLPCIRSTGNIVPVKSPNTQSSNAESQLNVDVDSDIMSPVKAVGEIIIKEPMRSFRV